MSAITITTTLDEIKAALPAEFAPVLDNAAAAFLIWGKDQVTAWLSLAKADPDAARAELLGAMSEEALTAQGELDGAALDAAVAANADNVAKWQGIIKDLWNVLLVIAGGIITVSL